MVKNFCWDRPGYGGKIYKRVVEVAVAALVGGEIHLGERR